MSESANGRPGGACAGGDPALACSAALSGFYGRWQQSVLAYLTGARPCGRDPARHEFVDRIHSEWRQQFGQLNLPDALPAERTFWKALEQIETWSPVAGLTRTPRTEGAMRIRVEELAVRLADWRGLPRGCHAYRPGERRVVVQCAPVDKPP